MNERKKQIIFLLILVFLGANLSVFLFRYFKLKQQTVYSPEKKVLGATSLKARGDLDKHKTKPYLKPGEKFEPKQLSAKSVLVYDWNSKENLFELEPEKKLSIASLTKLMTGLLTYENLNFQDKLLAEKNDLLEVSPSLHFKSGEVMKTFDLFASMLIGSNNDSALLLANKVSSLKNVSFENLMNDKAKQLGMLNSSFSNPLGFDSKDNFSTASDLKILVEATQNFAAFANLGKTALYSFVSDQGNIYKTKTTNRLFVKHPEIELIKTGHTQEAAGNLITKVSDNGHKFVVIVLGSNDREADTLKIVSEVKQKFVWD